MQRPSLTTILSSAFLLYIAYSMFTLYSLFYPPMCTSSGAQCLRPLWHSTDTPLLQLRLYISTKPDAVIGTRAGSEEIYRSTTVNLSLISDHQIEFDVPALTRRNGSMFITCFLLPSDYSHPNPYMAQWHLVQSTKMTTFIVPQMPAFQLTAATADHVDQQQQQQLPRTHFYSKLTLLLLDDQLEFDWQHLPSDIAHLIKLDSSTRKYYPIVYLDDMSLRTKDLVQLTVNTTTTNMSLHLQPIGIGKLRLLITAHHSLEHLRQLGFGDKDIDEVKSIFVDTNFYLLSLTVAIAAIHMLLDVLAFKNDIAFWRERDSRIGLSTRSLLWNTFSQLIIFLYLHEQHSSLLVLIPSGIALVIEVWKIKKAFKLSFSMIAGRPSIRIGSSSTAELLTDNLDSTGMHYLGLVLIPVCISGAIYSFMYIPHRSLYGWAIQSCANGVYAFGFLFMLPQLFINYKMKSVAHLPWRAFMYKAFNTFVDDLFSFIITMPTAHRLACFRDDVVFFVYLYQRYLYPVDKKRSNEFGQSFNDDQSKSKTE